MQDASRYTLTLSKTLLRSIWFLHVAGRFERQVPKSKPNRTIIMSFSCKQHSPLAPGENGSALDTKRFSLV